MFEDGKIHIDCSEVKSIIMHTHTRRTKVERATDADYLTSADFDIASEGGYVRFTLTDENGRHANTNAYYTDELFE